MSDTIIDFGEAKYTLSNCIRITLQVEGYKTEVNTSLNGENWVFVTDYVEQLITQAKQQTCDDILGLLPDDNVVTKEFGYNSDEKKFGFRIGVAATIKAIKQYREGL